MDCVTARPPPSFCFSLRECLELAPLLGTWARVIEPEAATMGSGGDSRHPWYECPREGKHVRWAGGGGWWRRACVVRVVQKGLDITKAEVSLLESFV